MLKRKITEERKIFFYSHTFTNMSSAFSTRAPCASNQDHASDITDLYSGIWDDKNHHSGTF